MTAWLFSGVSFKEGAGDECAAAVAILLFGNSGSVLPGGYAGEELSTNSPIVFVREFPSEFILLGRATVMIRGIANRLGIRWSLSDRWAPVARETLSVIDPMDLQPVWNVAMPTVTTAQDTADVRALSGKIYGSRQVKFQDVAKSFRVTAGMFKVRSNLCTDFRLGYVHATNHLAGILGGQSLPVVSKFLAIANRQIHFKVHRILALSLTSYSILIAT